MFGLGVGEIIIILVVALIFIGPKKLPELARGLGKGMREFQNAARGIQETIKNPAPPEQSQQIADKPVPDETEQEEAHVDAEYHAQHPEEDPTIVVEKGDVSPKHDKKS